MITVKQVMDMAIEIGKEADFRSASALKKYLSLAKEEYSNLKEDEKEYYDQEKLINPYSDTRFQCGDAKKIVKRVLVGIDISPAEILLASQLNERGKEIDLVIAHHPLGLSLAALHDSMSMMIDLFVEYGVPVHLAEKIMEERIKEVSRSVGPSNHYQVTDMARILGVNLINVHTPADNLVKKFLDEYILKKKPENLGQLVKMLLEIPEYQEAKRRGNGPKIFTGSPKSKIGKFMVGMTGGTNPSAKIMPELSRAGVSTVIDMHMREDSIEKSNEHHLNVVIAGHISSDSLGMNLFLDELEKKGVEIIPCSGLIRVSRNKKK